LTRATERGYIGGVVKGEVSAAGAGIRGVPGKANSYPYKYVIKASANKKQEEEEPDSPLKI